MNFSKQLIGPRLAVPSLDNVTSLEEKTPQPLPLKQFEVQKPTTTYVPFDLGLIGGTAGDYSVLPVNKNPLSSADAAKSPTRKFAPSDD